MPLYIPDRLSARGDWLATAFAILSPTCATVLGSSGNAVALGIFFWTLGAACPLAWILSERRTSSRRAHILNAGCIAEDGKEGDSRD